MIYFNTLLIAALLFIAAHAAELKPQECTIIVKSSLQMSESAHDTSFECIFDYSISANADTTGQKTRTLPILLNDPQLKLFNNRFEKGELISSLSTLILEGIEISNNGIIIPSDKNTFDFGMIKNESSRRLRTTVTGEKRFLVVKVIDSNGEKLPQNLDQIGNDIYGPTDTMTLKSQMEACSYDKLKILPGVQSAAEVAHGNGKGNGVIQVTIDKPLNGSTDFEIRKEVSNKVEEALGITLPGPYDHVMYTLAKCYGNQCGWAAYAYVNSWLSVYQGQYYRMVGVQMHEIGHNFNLAHSGGLNGLTYTDHTGLMGNPLYSDDVGAMCFNPAKNWQLGWYADREILINPRQQRTWTGTIVGIADYGNNPNKYPVVVKIETGTSKDQFIGFNRATGINRHNDEADNEVTVVETTSNGEYYAQSFLKATLMAGQVYTYPNWDGTDDLTVEAKVIEMNNGSNPGYAEISVCLGPCELPTARPSLRGSSAPSVSPNNPPSTSPLTYDQMGNDIDGVITDDFFGQSVAMSKDGLRSAITSPGSSNGKGIIRVFDWDTNSQDWVQIGQDIVGTVAAGSLGWSIDMNDDGSRIIVGAPEANNDDGLVRVYELDSSSSTWQLLGSEIKPISGSEGQAGVSVTMNFDGSRIAYGAPRTNDYRGRVTALQLVGGQWQPLGQNIDCPETYAYYSSYSGGSIAMNADGKTLIIGGRLGNKNTGYVKVYTFSDSSAQWEMHGSTLIGESYYDRFGGDVDISEDGTRIVVGAPTSDGAQTATSAGEFQVFDYDGMDWNRLGQPIGGAYALDKLGNSVAISGDGTHVVVSSPQNDENGSNAGKVEIYKYSAGDGIWLKQANDILGTTEDEMLGEGDNAVAIDRSGKHIVLGARRGNYYAGAARIYKSSLA